ncbi:MAG: HAD family phosphatase, partial [Firmicutes bacterium]|nr:HAD family phosphatase [Bacillota bacterium]
MKDLHRMRGAIFDLDGTLLDSMGMWQDIDRRYLARFGKAAPADLQRRIEGFSVTETARYFKETFGLPDDIPAIIADWNEMAKEEYRFHLQLKPGAETFVRRLHGAGILLAVATTNYRDLTEACLERLGILGLF